MLRGLWDGAGEVGPLSLDALIRHRVTVLGTHTLAQAQWAKTVNDQVIPPGL